MSLTAELHRDYRQARLRQLFAKGRQDLAKLQLKHTDALGNPEYGKLVRKEKFWNKVRKYWNTKANQLKAVINCEGNVK